MSGHNCSVPNCSEKAAVEVILYDVYDTGEVFFEQDSTCPYLCHGHVAENEASIQGNRVPGNTVNYKYSNRHSAQGFTIYRPIKNHY